MLTDSYHRPPWTVHACLDIVGEDTLSDMAVLWCAWVPLPFGNSVGEA